VIRSLKDRLRSRFNVSVSETAFQDVWTRAEVSVALVTTDGHGAEALLDRMDHFVAENARAVIVGRRRDFH